MHMHKLLFAGFIFVLILALTGCLTPRKGVELTIQIRGEGQVEPSGTRRYQEGAIVELQAAARDGWQLVRWQGDVAEALSPTTSVVMEQAQTIEAIFIPTSPPAIVTAPGGTLRWRADGSEVARRPQGTADIKYIMIHTISDAAANPTNPYQLDRIQTIFHTYSVEAHYLIDRVGTIYRFVEDERVARHAGVGSWPGDPRVTNNMNRYALGIELMGIGTKEEMQDVIGLVANARVKDQDRGYTEEQYAALEALLHHLTASYGITPERIISHKAYDPGRKWDPGALFDWSKIGLKK